MRQKIFVKIVHDSEQLMTIPAYTLKAYYHMDKDEGIVNVSSNHDEKGLELLVLWKDTGKWIPFHLPYLWGGVLLYPHVEAFQGASLYEGSSD